jgi:hypothetical protein
VATPIVDKPRPQSLEFTPKFLEVDLEGIGTCVEVPIPHIFVDLLSREDLAGMSEEKREQGQFLGREIERSPATLGALRD